MFSWRTSQLTDGSAYWSGNVYPVLNKELAAALSSSSSYLPWSNSISDIATAERKRERKRGEQKAFAKMNSDAGRKEGGPTSGVCVTVRRSVGQAGRQAGLARSTLPKVRACNVELRRSVAGGQR